MVSFGSGSDADSAEPEWLETLPNHPIFTPQASSASGRQCMAVRNSDLIVATGRSLRMANLLEVKHSSDAARSSFKELVSEALDFDIVEVILNPTGKLLAVVGSHAVAIVVLPRSGAYSSKSIGKQVAVKAAPVGSYYYHSRSGGRTRVACVKWHPWGQLGSSLLVMSRDGLLREFDVANDVQEPTQSVSLLPSTSTSSSDISTKARSRSRRAASRSRSQTPQMHRSMRSTSRFALDDDEIDGENSEEDYIDEPLKKRASMAATAVAFTFGIDHRDDAAVEDAMQASPTSWNPFTLFTICSNGDVYALCPFMPKNAVIPLSYLRQLPVLPSKGAEGSASSSPKLDLDLQNRFVTSLLKQVRSEKQTRQASFSPDRSRRSISATPMSLDPRASAPPEDETDVEEGDEIFAVQAPTAAMIPQQAEPQGPFLMWPAPIELSEERENRSTDIFYARRLLDEASLDLIGILGDDGRIDLCLLLEAIVPHWAAPPTGARKRVASSGRYALSDSEDEESPREDLSKERQLPTVFVYETVDLGISHLELSTGPPGSGPQFILDPLNADTVYIKHATGAHTLSFARWTRKLLSAMQTPEEERAAAMERALHETIPSDVLRAVETTTLPTQQRNEVVGLCIINDVYLSYAFLALTHSGAVAALELGLRTGSLGSPMDGQDEMKKTPSALDGPVVYTSLLGDGPSFTPPEPFKMLNGTTYHPRRAIKGNHSGKELEVSTETLRALATVVSSLRGEMRKIVQGGNVVQSRIELQNNELNRQLAKLTEARDRLNQGRKREEVLEHRMKSLASKQHGLIKRSDRLLQKLFENHSPDISVYEARWFKELERLAEDVGSSSATSGLEGRIVELRHQLEEARPHLVAEKERKRQESKNKRLGSTQVQGIESILANESKLLALDREAISRLQTKLQRQTAMY